MTSEEYHGLHQDEANRHRALRRQEDAVLRVERERFARRISAMGPGPQIESDFPGCTVDAPPEAA